MASIPDEKVQEVRDRVDIVDLVGRYVDLRRSGMNYKGLCPFHRERSPSFNVNPARKGYKCFGCGAGGDAIRCVMELEGKSFPEAIRKLAEMYGVHLPAPTGGRRDADDANERDRAYRLMRLATDTYGQILHDSPHGDAGRRYVAARRLARSQRLAAMHEVRDMLAALVDGFPEAALHEPLIGDLERVERQLELLDPS